VPLCRRYNVGIIPYHPLAAGFLTGKYRQGKPIPPGTRFALTPRHNHFFSEENFSRLAQLERFAQERRHSVAELALAWLFANPQMSTVIAGASTPEQIAANLRALEWKLTEEELGEIGRIVRSDDS